MPSDVRPGAVVADFRIDSLVGEGATGAVYLAEDVDTGERVALKMLVPDLAGDERFRQRFLRESELAARLDHPSVVRTIAAGEEAGRLFLAMAYVDGPDLREVLRRDGPLEPERAIRLVAQAASALDAAHAAGLVHRDVKPGNILVASDADGEHASICDFGLARHVSSVSSLTGDRGFVGTIDYVPPEQIAGHALDGRADVYSLGCVLFECLTGARPFERDSELAVVFAHLNEPPPRVTDLRPDLPARLDGVVATALAKEPAERYATCGELAEAARAAFSGDRVPRRKPRRRRYLLAVAGVLLAAALGAGVVAATGHDGPPRAVSITQSSIAGARLGEVASVYKQRYGIGWREDVLTAPNYPVLIYHDRKIAMYFDDTTRRSIIVTTWNRDHRTRAGVGPCSSVDDLRSAYGRDLRPSHWNTVDGKVYAYTVGENLLFAVGGKPPNPGNTVTAVALYDGNGPGDDGAGVDVEGGTLPFAAFVAISEAPCA